MFNAFMQYIGQAFNKAIERRMPAGQSVIRLNSRSIYILPTRYGIVFGFMLFAMLVGSINYEINMGFILTFLITGIAMAGMLYSYRNLCFVQLKAHGAAAVFAGQNAIFQFTISTSNAYKAINITLQSDTGKISNICASASVTTVKLSVPTQQRGIQTLKKIWLSTEYPLGLFHVWSWLAPKAEVIVYPKPISLIAEPKYITNANDGNQQDKSGDDDFYGLRNYQQGDSRKNIAWKILARQEVLYSKQLSGFSKKEIWLDWDALTPLDTESRLSQLCYWVLKLDKSQCIYGLCLPDKIIDIGQGEQHKHQCLQALALFNQ